MSASALSPIPFSPDQPSAAAPVRVFLSDDALLIRERVSAMLAVSSMLVVGQAATPQASIDGILGTRPDVVVLDIALEGGTGLQVLQAVRQLAPEVAFVVFSGNSGPAYRKRYLAAGACDFLDKNSESARLAAAVLQAHHAAH